MDYKLLNFLYAWFSFSLQAFAYSATQIAQWDLTAEQVPTLGAAHLLCWSWANRTGDFVQHLVKLVSPVCWITWIRDSVDVCQKTLESLYLLWLQSLAKCLVYSRQITHEACNFTMYAKDLMAGNSLCVEVIVFMLAVSYGKLLNNNGIRQFTLC